MPQNCEIVEGRKIEDSGLSELNYWNMRGTKRYEGAITVKMFVFRGFFGLVFLVGTGSVCGRLAWVLTSALAWSTAIELLRARKPYRGDVAFRCVEEENGGKANTWKPLVMECSDDGDVRH